VDGPGFEGHVGLDQGGVVVVAGNDPFAADFVVGGELFAEVRVGGELGG
jgi:hypothetical protein